MGLFRRALFRRVVPEQAGSLVGSVRCSVSPWLMLAGFVLVVDVATAAVLVALHFSTPAVLYLVSGASGVALATVSTLYQLFGKAAETPSVGGGR